jgi:hypothetical protein
MTFPVALLVALVLALTGAEGAAQSAPEPPAPPACGKQLCIGVREHARPFSYRPETDARTDASAGPLSAAGYSGYMIRICDAVLQQMILDGDLDGPADIGIVDIDRLPMVEGDRLDRLGRDFDILCDPATITNTRRTDYMVSPPLFLTGISILSPPGLFPENICGVLRGREGPVLLAVVGGTNAGEAGVRALIQSGAVASLNAELNNYLAGRPICEGVVEADRLVRTFATHPEAAKAFCDAPDKQMRALYYLGDLEIIVANAEAVPGCTPERPVQTYTNDRYAIFARADWTDQDRARLIARFYETLSRKVVFSPSLLDQAFTDTFIGQRPSRKLELFLWSIRGELRPP